MSTFLFESTVIAKFKILTYIDLWITQNKKIIGIFVLTKVEPQQLSHSPIFVDLQVYRAQTLTSVDFCWPFIKLLVHRLHPQRILCTLYVLSHHTHQPRCNKQTHVPNCHHHIDSFCLRQRTQTQFIMSGKINLVNNICNKLASIRLSLHILYCNTRWLPYLVLLPLHIHQSSFVLRSKSVQASYQLTPRHLFPCPKKSGK